MAMKYVWRLRKKSSDSVAKAGTEITVINSTCNVGHITSDEIKQGLINAGYPVSEGLNYYWSAWEVVEKEQRNL
ncbi:MAG: hypothetical protein IJU90_04750 [Bacteroidales bacterium]|nr:hypothetical protein [Bacteroidales bacterium]